MIMHSTRFPDSLAIANTGNSSYRCSPIKSTIEVSPSAPFSQQVLRRLLVFLKICQVMHHQFHNSFGEHQTVFRFFEEERF